MSVPSRIDRAAGPSTWAFLGQAMLWHTVTYLLAGLVASRLLDYQTALAEPIIRDYMRDFASNQVGVGPWFQPLRGLIYGIVLLPFRATLAAPRGWLWLWALLVGVGILNTSAAAPSSIEGLLYTRVPLWYHLFGLPEVCLQTLAFSVLLQRSLRPHATRTSSPLLQRVIAAVAGACFAFVGYAAVSIAFAFAVGQGFQTDGVMSMKTQRLFIAPLVLLATLIFIGRSGIKPFDRPWVIGLAAWVSNAVAIVAWQAWVMLSVSVVYALVAPVLPAFIAAFSGKPTSKPQPGVQQSV